MVKNRFFLDIDKEEQWLNELAQSGYCLTHRFFYMYTFEQSDERYTYYVDHRFLRHNYQEFCNFLQELNVQFVTASLGWCYFRSKQDEQHAPIYTDTTSRKQYYLRMIAVLILVILFNLKIISHNSGPYIFNISFSIVANSLILCFSVLNILKYLKKISILSSKSTE